MVRFSVFLSGTQKRLHGWSSLMLFGYRVGRDFGEISAAGCFTVKSDMHVSHRKRW